MRSNSVKLLRTVNIFYFLILALFLYHVFFFTDMQDFILAGKEAENRDYTSGWYLESGERIDLNDINAGMYGGSYTVTKTLPRIMKETDSIYFSTSNLNFDVYVNDELIYTYRTIKNCTGMGDGVSYHMIGLGIKDQGNTVRIDASSAFSDGYGGRINDMQFGQEELYRYSLISDKGMAVNISLILIIFGLFLIMFFLVMHKERLLLKSFWALGLSAMLFGLWCLFDTGIPQLTIGSIYASREISYIVLHLACFPLVYFVNSKTKLKRPVFSNLSFVFTLLFLGLLFYSRFMLGTDMHSMVGVIYLSYASQLLLVILMLVDNEYYCRKNSLSSSMALFYTGSGILLATALIDMRRFLFIRKGSLGQGNWTRFGSLVFFLLSGCQVFIWWFKERKSLERDRFVNRLLQYIMDSDNPESKIDKVLEYMCKELHADRAYIFEDMKDGTFDNTYEYCSEGVTPEIDNLKGLPYEGVIDVWYREYKKGGHILIYDLEKYRAVSESMYQILKPQGINTLVTGPLILDGEYIGFFGVDNPPSENMKEISEIIRLLMFFLSDLVERRNYHRRLVEYSYQDAMTEVGNRRAIKEFENSTLDTSKPYGFIMCDINGLKDVNDNQGHEAGDELIKNVTRCLTGIFGRENVYRMGGDEFAAYVCDVNLQTMEEMVAKLRAEVTEKGYHVALGYSYSGGGDPDYNAHKLEADNKMYEEKREYYRTSNDRRRR